MADRLPPLFTLRAFEAVARLGSVTRAAAELGRTHGAVSKQLRALHADAGLPLFDKVGTGLRANAAGRQLAAAVAAAFDGLADSYATVVREARSPALHVACSATFAMGWLVPHLAEFARAHPEVRIRLSMTSAREMRDERDADLVVLWDRSAYPAQDQARAIRLADARFGVVAAPDYPVARNDDGSLSADCRIVHDHTSSAWDRWTALSGIAVAAPRTLSFPHTHLCLGAAVAGMGIAMAERRLAAADLAAGRLVQVTGFTAFPHGFAAIPHRTRPPSPQSRLFLDWLAAALQADG
ncbi:LysR substrate-binding domain-containing protein [Phenylobacterium sp.]|uniref:LysR substrate-binding domain-containing protein n=1 Tax=Phenylobacterium sp. TaxID=1871053 RepID=UPI0025D2D1C0|nr:LysR substrate-binding domain-containing protein [Phenylobacterium sp.]